MPELDIASLPHDQGSLNDMNDFGDTFEPEDPSVLAEFFDLDDPQGISASQKSI